MNKTPEAMFARKLGFGCMRLPMKNGEVDTAQFSAMVETFFRLEGEDWDPMRVDYALRQLDAW